MAVPHVKNSPKTKFRLAYRSVAYCHGATITRLRGESRGQALQEAVLSRRARNIVCLLPDCGYFYLHDEVLDAEGFGGVWLGSDARTAPHGDRGHSRLRLAGPRAPRGRP